jgi:hypothetical protein
VAKDDLDNDGIKDNVDTDIDGDGILNTTDKRPREFDMPTPTGSQPQAGTPQPRPTFAFGGANGSSAPIGLDLGFGLDQRLSAFQMGAYITGLAGSNPKKYQQIKNSINSALNTKYNNPATIGAAVQRLAENIQLSPDPLQKTISIEEYLNRARASVASTTQPTAQVFETTKAQAKAELDAEFAKLYGTAATDQDVNEYYKELVSAQRTNPLKTIRKDGKVTQVGGLGADAKQAILNKAIVKKSNVATSQDSVAKLGGDFGVSVDSLRKTAGDYGVILTDDQLKSYALSSITSKGGLDNEITKIKNIAKGLYSSLGSYIDQGLSVRDLLQPYMNKKAELLEIPVNQIALNNNEGQQLLKNVVGKDQLLPLYDYEASLRQDPRWRFTKNANETASSYVLQVLKDFGIAG